MGAFQTPLWWYNMRGEALMLLNTFKILLLAAAITMLVVASWAPHNFGLSEQPDPKAWVTCDFCFGGWFEAPLEKAAFRGFDPIPTLIAIALIVSLFLWQFWLQRTPAPTVRTIRTIVENSRFLHVKSLHYPTKAKPRRPKAKRAMPIL